MERRFDVNVDTDDSAEMHRLCEASNEAGDVKRQIRILAFVALLSILCTRFPFSCSPRAV